MVSFLKFNLTLVLLNSPSKYGAHISTVEKLALFKRMFVSFWSVSTETSNDSLDELSSSEVLFNVAFLNSSPI